ncbi:hypothetical protein EU545_02015 [Candidatus Thorarchaeota archaeon]|nr:MAG: hypothetical protein EU545_02015 [Candidatus Thorarchaeota archaeon]
MSFDIIVEPMVRAPKTAKPRRGRGFSRDELEQAELTMKDARDMSVLVDIRRKTAYPENVEALKQYLKDLEKIAAALEKEAAPKIDADAAAAELSSLRAVKKAEAPLLVDAGILSLEDLAYCEIEKVAKKTGIDEERITAMVKSALNKI